MPAVMTTVGAEKMALIKLGKNAFKTMTVGLFENNYTPTVSSALGDFTPSSLTGELPIDKTTWAGTASAGSWTGSPDLLTYTMAANPTAKLIYGYYVRDTDNDILWAERYVTPWTPPVLASTWMVDIIDTHHMG